MFTSFPPTTAMTPLHASNTLARAVVRPSAAPMELDNFSTVAPLKGKYATDEKAGALLSNVAVIGA